MKKERGITLVSLVVTIIILIILAGISINLTLGENGIITIAKQAKENTELAKIEEETALNELYNELESGSSSGISYDTVEKIKELENKLSNLQNEFNNLQIEYNSFKTIVAQAITDMGITTAEDADASTMASNIRSISSSQTSKIQTINTTLNGGTNPWVFVFNALAEVEFVTIEYSYQDFHHSLNSNTNSESFTISGNNVNYSHGIDTANWSIICTATGY